MITLDASLIIDGEPYQKTSLLTEKIEETDNSDEETRFFHGVLSGTLISLLIWAFILWIVL